MDEGQIPPMSDKELEMLDKLTRHTMENGFLKMMDRMIYGVSYERADGTRIDPSSVRES
jgi:hypothetical protein